MSASTMRRLVDLARARKRKKEQAEALEKAREARSSSHLSGARLSRRKILQRTKTPTAGLASLSPEKQMEERIAKRLSTKLEMAPMDMLHIRSYSVPKVRPVDLDAFGNPMEDSSASDYLENSFEESSSYEDTEASSSRPVVLRPIGLSLDFEADSDSVASGSGEVVAGRKHRRSRSRSKSRSESENDAIGDIAVARMSGHKKRKSSSFQSKLLSLPETLTLDEAEAGESTTVVVRNSSDEDRIASDIDEEIVAGDEEADDSESLEHCETQPPPLVVRKSLSSDVSDFEGDFVGAIVDRGKGHTVKALTKAITPLMGTGTMGVGGVDADSGEDEFKRQSPQYLTHDKARKSKSKSLSYDPPTVTATATAVDVEEDDSEFTPKQSPAYSAVKSQSQQSLRSRSSSPKASTSSWLCCLWCCRGSKGKVASAPTAATSPGSREPPMIDLRQMDNFRGERIATESLTKAEDLFEEKTALNLPKVEEEDSGESEELIQDDLARDSEEEEEDLDEEEELGEEEEEEDEYEDDDLQPVLSLEGLTCESETFEDAAERSLSGDTPVPLLATGSPKLAFKESNGLKALVATALREGESVRSLESVLSLEIADTEWRTASSTVTMLRRPTAFSTATQSRENTLQSSDVRMWLEPFGRGASGRVYKSLYLPRCQVMACKVSSRLDKVAVRQLLEEFDAQCHVLPSCKQLMQIHGWYRDLDKNEVVVALEYMDLGSIFDSCFEESAPAKGGVVLSVSAMGGDCKAQALREKATGHSQVRVAKLSYAQIRCIARESLIGLHALHCCSPSGNALIHRDIKPQNILLSSFGDVKIADFGLLYELKEEESECLSSDGTMKYFSPQRAADSPRFGTATDIWSFGITMIEVFNQRLIDPRLLGVFTIGDGVDVRQFLPESAPTEFVDLVRQCTIADASQRPSALQLLQLPLLTRGWPPVADSLLADTYSATFDEREAKALLHKLRKPQPNLVSFAEVKPNKDMLDKLLTWLEAWILEDDRNAKCFSDGHSADLRQCVCNLARNTGQPPKFIDAYIGEIYRELL